MMKRQELAGTAVTRSSQLLAPLVVTWRRCPLPSGLPSAASSTTATAGLMSSGVMQQASPGPMQPQPGLPPQPDWAAPQPLMLGQPSTNLQDMCALQLGLLQLLLQKCSGKDYQLRAAVYVRAPGPEAAAGTVCLRKVAATAAHQGGTSNHPSATIVAAGDDGWAGGGASLHAHGDVILLQLAEECLVNEEVLLLPSSGSLVLPLVDTHGGRTLVGMLLVEAPPAAVASQQPPMYTAPAGTPTASAAAAATAAAAAASGGSSARDYGGQGTQVAVPTDHLPLSTCQPFYGTSGAAARELGGRLSSSPPPASPAAPAAGTAAAAASPAWDARRGETNTALAPPSAGAVVTSNASTAPQSNGGLLHHAAAATAAAVQPGTSVTCMPAAHLQRAGGSPGPLADGHFITEPQGGRLPSWVETYPGFTDDELLALRATAPVLAKACALELSASAAALQGAAANTRAAVAASLVQQARRPMATVNSLSAMLLPRLEEGTPDRDLVRSIRVQGERLQDLLRQLDAALGPRPNPLAPPGRSYPLPTACPPFPTPLAGWGSPPHPIPPAPASPQVAPAMTPPMASPPLGKGPRVFADFELPGSEAAASAAMSAAPAARQPQQQQQLQQQQVQQAVLEPPLPAATPQQQELPHAPQQSPQQAASAAMSAQGAQAQAGGRALPASETTQAAASAAAVHSTSSAGSSQAALNAAAAPSAAEEAPPANRTFTMRLTPAEDGSISTDGVIDMELDASEAGSAGASAAAAVAAPTTAAAAPTATAGSRSRARAWHAKGDSTGRRHVTPIKTSTDVVSALVNVLTAAARLARVSGVYFCVQHPLRIAGNSPASVVASATAATATNSTTSATTTNSATSRAASRSPSPPPSSPGSSVWTAAKHMAGLPVSSPVSAPLVPELAPRPSRPLFVAVRASLLVRIVAYVVDLALQCTPRGGIVGVSATQLNSWVELVVSHTGQMVIQRLHPRSAGLHSTGAAVTSTTSSSSSGSSHPASPSSAHHTASPAAHTASGRAKPRTATSDMVAVARSSTSAAGRRRGSSATVVAAAGSDGATEQAGAGNVMGTAQAAPTLPGSGALSFSMAEELVAAVGGTITSHFPVHLHNALTEHMEIGTRVVIRLPAAHI